MQISAKFIVAQYKPPANASFGESNTVRGYFRGIDLRQYPKFKPEYSKGVLTITLYKSEDAKGLKTAQNLGSAALSNGKTAIAPYVAFAQRKYLGDVFVNTTIESDAKIVENTPERMVLEFAFAGLKRRAKPQVKVAKIAPAKTSTAPVKRPTIPASVIASLVANNAAKIREVEIDGVVFEVV